MRTAMLRNVIGVQRKSGCPHHVSLPTGRCGAGERGVPSLMFERCSESLVNYSKRRESSCAELKLLHFDTRQYLHFGWSTHAELRERLELHIRATIPGRATAKRRGKG